MRNFHLEMHSKEFRWLTCFWFSNLNKEICLAPIIFREFVSFLNDFGLRSGWFEILCCEIVITSRIAKNRLRNIVNQKRSVYLSGKNIIIGIVTKLWYLTRLAQTSVYLNVVQSQVFSVSWKRLAWSNQSDPSLFKRHRGYEQISFRNSPTRFQIIRSFSGCVFLWSASKTKQLSEW